MQNLQSLEELGIDDCKKLSYNKLIELKVLPKLRLLNCSGAGEYSDFDLMETNLKKQMPHLVFSNYYQMEEKNEHGHDGIWEIKVNRFQFRPDPLTMRWRENRSRERSLSLKSRVPT